MYIYILIIIITALIIYVAYLRNKDKELKNLQLMIALLQEQTLFLGDIDPAKYILEQEGNLETLKLDEVKKVLSKAYRDGFYLLDAQSKVQVLDTRKKAEKLLLRKISYKKFSSQKFHKVN